MVTHPPILECHVLFECPLIRIVLLFDSLLFCDFVKNSPIVLHSSLHKLPKGLISNIRSMKESYHPLDNRIRWFVLFIETCLKHHPKPNCPSFDGTFLTPTPSLRSSRTLPFYINWWAIKIWFFSVEEVMTLFERVCEHLNQQNYEPPVVSAIVTLNGALKTFGPQAEILYKEQVDKLQVNQNYIFIHFEISRKTYLKTFLHR